MKYLVKFTLDNKAWEVGATETEIEAKAFATGYACAIINHTKSGIDDKQKQTLASQFQVVRIGDEGKPAKKVVKKDVKKKEKKNVRKSKK